MRVINDGKLTAENGEVRAGAQTPELDDPVHKYLIDRVTSAKRAGKNKVGREGG